MSVSSAENPSAAELFRLLQTADPPQNVLARLRERGFVAAAGSTGTRSTSCEPAGLLALDADRSMVRRINAHPFASPVSSSGCSCDQDERATGSRCAG